MNSEAYYIAPKQEIFEEIKCKSIELWGTYSDEFGYASEKINRIKDIGNIKDNTAYMVAMFDQNNQDRLLGMVNDETAVWLEDLLKYGRGA